MHADFYYLFEHEPFNKADSVWLIYLSMNHSIKAGGVWSI